MDTVGHEQHIKSIIKLEERIGQCRRCPELIRCTSKPSLGKGDFEPEALLVFENDSKQTSNIKWIIELRNLIKKHFNIARVYHTYLMRCHPKSCISNHGNDCCLPSKLVNRNNICLLNQQLCDGIPIKPSNEEIINCMYFLLEEIEVLKPHRVEALEVQKARKLRPVAPFQFIERYGGVAEKGELAALAEVEGDKVAVG